MRSRSSAPFPCALALILSVCLLSCGAEDEEAPAQTGALIVTSDFESGAVSSVDLDSRRVSVNLGTIHSDAVCRAEGGLVYVVNRLGQDNIQVLDPAAGYSTLRQFSTGNGSNPQDICLASETKAYVPTYGLAELTIVNPQAGTVLGRLDLSSLADSDGIPEMSACAVVEERLYVTLQNLQDFAPTGQSRMAILDTRTDTLVRAEPLQGQNPFTRLIHDRDRDRLLFGTVGDFGVLDGGIEAFDLRRGRSSGFVVTEQALGGDVGGVALFRDDRSFALITSASFATSVVSFDARNGQRLSTVLDSADADPNDSDFDLSALAVNDRGELWIADGSFTAPGLRLFDAASGQSLIGTPLDVGLPPRDICFTTR
jgi:hypothetical protein